MPVENMPKVSVCIPTFNGAEYLCHTIESVLEQSYHDYEIVLVDNCSTDNTVALVDKLQKKNTSRIRFYQNDRNIGLVGNLNRCIEYARGAYIKFLCADDLLLPGCLEQMTAVLDTQPSVKLVAGGRAIIDEHGRNLTVRTYSNTNVLVPGTKAITECLFGRHYIGEPTAVMFRKSDMAAGFREDLPQVLDIDMWFRLLEQGDLLYIGTPLSAIRQHASQMTHANIRSETLIDDNIKLFETYSHKSYIKPTLYFRLQHKIYMTYRVWRSRQYISSEKKKMVLHQYGSTLAYSLMPIAEFALNFLRKMKIFLTTN
jgi:glycosyltransferase involved in cell wall biosynthesis